LLDHFTKNNFSRRMDVSRQKAVRQIGLLWRDRVRRKASKGEETKPEAKREVQGEAEEVTVKDEVDEVEFPFYFADGRRVGHFSACFIHL
jgi:hypothetical protein